MGLGGMEPVSGSVATAGMRMDPGADKASAQKTPNADGTRATQSAAPKASPSATQDDAVQISPQGHAAASSDDDNGVDNATDQAEGSQTESTDTAPKGETESAAQPVQSFVYGALDLDPPDQPTDPDTAYTAGKWLVAGITVGGIISLFV